MGVSGGSAEQNRETIELINLPPEVIPHILGQRLNNLHDVIMLSMTCQHFQEFYKANKNYIIQQKYMTAWKLLLREEFRDASKAREFVRIILELLPYISHGEIKEHSKNLFGTDFPEAFFEWLSDFCLDQCLQLIIKHFDIKQARCFIQKLCSPSLALNDLRCIVRGRYPSFLHYAIASLPISTGDEKRGLIILLDLLLKKGCDLEQHNKLGETALNYILNLMGRKK
jgi:hypothetical protein